MRIRINVISVLSFLFVSFFAGSIQAQEDNGQKETNRTAEADSAMIAAKFSADSAVVLAPGTELRSFKPSPKKAVWMAVAFPGLGQIYNRKYWKLPILYGGFMACTYAITWNNKNLTDYSQAYKDIMSSDPEKNNSWQNFLPVGADPKDYINSTTFQDQLKRTKDFYRRYRDLSIIITVGIYVLSIVDAYVDAQLFDFDISPDLSMQVVPSMEGPTPYSSRTYGVNCSIKF